MPDTFSVNLPPLLKQHMANASRDANSSGEMPFLMDSLLSTAGSASPLMQLFLFVYRLVGNQFGIDPSLILTTLGFLWGLSKLYTQIYLFFFSLINRYLMCSINVSEDDSIYRHLMKWMSQHPSMKRNKYLTAQTIWKSAWDDDDDDEEEDAKSLFWTDGGDDEGSGNKYLNFSNMAARSVCIGACKILHSPSLTFHRLLDLFQLLEEAASGIAATTSKSSAPRKLSQAATVGVP